MIKLLRLVEGQQFAGQAVGQKPGDQVRGTDKAVPKGNQHPFKGRLVGEEAALEDKLSKKYQDFKDLGNKDTVKEITKQAAIAQYKDVDSYKDKDTGGIDTKDDTGNDKEEFTRITISRPKKSVTESRRLVGRRELDGRVVKIYKDTDWGEYAVELYTDGVHQEEASYHTDDKMDALHTAHHMLTGQHQKDIAEEEENPVDTITVDVPLMLRIMEFAREDAADDMALHDVCEQLVKLSAEKGTLSMQDYNAVISSAPAKEQGMAEDSKSPESEIERLKLRQNAEHGGASLQRQAATLARIRELEQQIKDKKGMAEGSQRVDSLVTDALKIMRGSELNDAVQALKTVLGNREYNDRRNHYSFYVRQLVNMYGQQGMGEGAPVTTTPGSIEPGGAVDNFKQQMANNTEIDYQKKQQGMEEGVAETMPMSDAVKVLRHYGADHFKTTSNELHFYKNGRPMSIDLIFNDDATRSVSLSQLNSVTRRLKGQSVEEGKADYNFSVEDLKRLERIRDLATLKAQAFELISKPSAKPMKPEKVEWFRGALERMNSPLKVIKLMYDLMLSGEGQSVIGSRSSMNPNVYRQRFGEQNVDEESIMELGADGSALGAVAQQKSLAAATTTANNTPASGSSTTSTSTSPTTSSTPKPTPQQQAIAGDVTPDEEDALARIKSNAGLKSQYDKLIAQAK
jgi:hypothetical protein